MSGFGRKWQIWRKDKNIFAVWAGHIWRVHYRDFQKTYNMIFDNHDRFFISDDQLSSYRKSNAHPINVPWKKIRQV